MADPPKKKQRSSRPLNDLDLQPRDPSTGSLISPIRAAPPSWMKPLKAPMPMVVEAVAKPPEQTIDSEDESRATSVGGSEARIAGYLAEKMNTNNLSGHCSATLAATKSDVLP